MAEELKEKKFTYEEDDKNIIEIFNDWMKESRSYHDYLKKFQKKSEEYYIGQQTDLGNIPQHMPDVVENRIFEAVETLVPIATASAHQFLVLPPTDVQSSKERAEKLQKVLTKKYQTLEIQRKLESTTRHILLYRFGVLKYGWDFDKNDVMVAIIDPRRVYVPRMAVEDPHDLPYVIEEQDYSYDEAKEIFGEDKIKNASLTVVEDKESYQGKDSLQKLYRVYETWTNDAVVWVSGDTVLKKEQNPYWDLVGEERSTLDREAEVLKIKKVQKFHNHLDNPEKPFVFFTTFKVKVNEPFGSVSLTEIGIPLQDTINVQKRQIVHNLKQMGNGQVLVDEDAMSQELSDNITNEPGAIIRGEGVASLNKVRREPGVPLPQGHFANLQHSEAVFDNLFGVHSATRGQAAAKTLGQDILSRQQDFTRIDLITRVLNRGVSRLANGLVQVMKMYYTENHVVKILGEEGASQLIQFSQNDIEDEIELDVRSGNTVVMDEVALRTEAVQLWQLGALDGVTLYERLKFPDPAKTAQRLVLWKQGQLDMETQAHLSEINAQAQGQLAAKAAGEGATPEEGRGTETPLNVIQRARESLGGSAPSLPGTPKTSNQ